MASRLLARSLLFVLLLATIASSSLLARHRALLKAHRGGTLQADATVPATERQQEAEKPVEVFESRRSPFLPRDSLSKILMFQVVGISHELLDSSVEFTTASEEDLFRFRALRHSMTLGGQPPGPGELTNSKAFKYGQRVQRVASENPRDPEPPLRATAELETNTPSDLLLELRRNAGHLLRQLNPQGAEDLMEAEEVQELQDLDAGRFTADGIPVDLTNNLEAVRAVYPYLRTRLTLLYAKVYRVRTFQLEVRMIDNWNEMSPSTLRACHKSGGVSMGDHIFNRGTKKLPINFANIEPSGDALTLEEQVNKFDQIRARPVLNCKLKKERDENVCADPPYELDYNKVYFGDLTGSTYNVQAMKLILDMLPNGLTKDQARRCLELYWELLIANTVDITAYHRVMRWPEELLLVTGNERARATALEALQKAPELFDKMCDALPVLVEQTLTRLGY